MKGRSVMRDVIRVPWRIAWGYSKPHRITRRLLEVEALSESQLMALQVSRIRTLLTHSYRNVPYYRRVLASAGQSLESIEKDPLDALNRMPFLDKTIIAGSFDDLISTDIESRKWRYNTSGGSTGEPVRFIRDAEYADYNAATKVLFDHWSGYRIGEPKIILWGSERDLHVGSEKLKTRVGRWLKNHHALNTLRMSESDMLNHIAVINIVRPVQILAYVESIYELARFVERKQMDVYRPLAVMTSAGTLQPNMREVIERVFKAPVYNRYGSREVGDVACECERHQGLHVNPLTHYVEIVSAEYASDGGDVGEIAVTLLTNHAMPLIRYRIGDLGAWAEKPCDCGRNWALLRNVSGRVNSVIRTSRGSYSSAALSSLLYFKNPGVPFGSFTRYQLIQTDRDRLALKIVVRDQDLWKEEMKTIREKLTRTFGTMVQVDIREVPSISASPSGKFHYIWSDVR